MSNSLQYIQDEKQKIETELLAWDASLPNNGAEQFRILYLGTKGKVKKVFELMGGVEKEDKKEAGLLLNELKQKTEEVYHTLLAAEKTIPQKNATTQEDLTLPGIALTIGNRHPIQQVRQEITQIFEKLGYSIREANEVEDEWHNFTALNMPEWHPARDMQDTFYVSEQPNYVLRTHTSNVQIRTMLQEKPPIRMIAPGRVYRNETISARSHCFFHQVEGMYVDEKVSFADLKHSLYTFVQAFFGENTKIRFRPSFFPFTEPSAEMDVSCFICNQKGCSVCKQSGWVEILGCGMIHPNVLKHCNMDSSLYSGFAFGMGIERLVMLKYQIRDIRKFSENDISFLSQFKA